MLGGLSSPADFPPPLPPSFPLPAPVTKPAAPAPAAPPRKVPPAIYYYDGDQGKLCRSNQAPEPSTLEDECLNASGLGGAWQTKSPASTVASTGDSGFGEHSPKDWTLSGGCSSREDLNS